MSIVRNTFSRLSLESQAADWSFISRFQNASHFQISRDIAVARFLSSENRWAHNPQLDITYKDFMHEYIDLEHMEAAPSAIPMNMGYDFPHHAVYPTNNPRKIRVVFNASQQCGNGLTLNDLLLLSPKLQSDLPIRHRH